MTIQDVEGGLGVSLPETTYVTGLAVMADAPLMGVSVPALPASPRDSLSASRSPPLPTAIRSRPLGDFMATIDWGDGSRIRSARSPQPGGAGKAFVVTCDHAYLQALAAPYMMPVLS